MHAPFRVVATPHFERDLRKLTRRHPELLPLYEELLTILRHDPHNRTGRHDIKKLSGVKSGEGQWRIRTGDYRLRYDIIHRTYAVAIDHSVILRISYCVERLIRSTQYAIR